MKLALLQSVFLYDVCLNVCVLEQPALCCSIDSILCSCVAALWAADLSQRGVILTELRIRLSAASVTAPTTHSVRLHNHNSTDTVLHTESPHAGL